jgi:hypothetical protein
MRFLRCAVLSIAAAGLLGGCATTQKVEMGSTDIDQAHQEVPANQLLDVGIQAFDPNIPEDGDDMIFPEIRRAESRYLPFHLKRTLERSGHWGAIWMVPESANSTDLMVQGKILDSDGETLELEIRLLDAAGNVWLEERYQGEADITRYADIDLGSDEDPFQDLYNRIANDMLEARRLHSASQLEEIRTVSQLRFAGDLAPDAFGGYLGVDSEGITRIRHLPSEGDPMLVRVVALRERDYMLMDTLNEHYAEFYTSMGEAYRQFREFNYEEVLALRQLRRDANVRLALGVVATIGGVALAVFDGGATATLLAPLLIGGGVLGAQSGWAMRSESMIHAVAVQELSRSFESDVTPRVIEVQGRTLKLTGSAETQYRNWRRLLREIYMAETGLDAVPEIRDAADDSSPEPPTP